MFLCLVEKKACALYSIIVHIFVAIFWVTRRRRRRSKIFQHNPLKSRVPTDTEDVFAPDAREASSECT